MPVSVSKAFTTVPNQQFTVATLTFANAGPTSIVYSLLDQLHVNNKTRGGPNANIHGWYDATRNAMFVDMSGSGQFYVGFAALQTMAGEQVANDSDSNTSTNDVAGWFTFDANGTLKGNTNEVTPNISVAFQDKFTVPAGGNVSRSFALTIQGSLAAAQSAIDTARGQAATYWFTQTATAYQSWLTGPGKKIVSFSDSGLNLMYSRALVNIKNTINPSSGAMPATTNPFAYSYKVWARDSAVTAIALDKAGFTAEAEAYWYWLAARQQGDGTFQTCFSLWDSSYEPFVQPEDDAMGMFLVGAWNHYKVTGNRSFLTALWPHLQLSANYIWSSLGNNSYNLGAEDFSIWEETYEYSLFSQASYVAGLDAAQYAAVAMARQDLADNYAGASSQIRTTIQRNDTWFPAGLWNVNSGYYDRAVNSNGTARSTVDSSSDILMVLGIIDPSSSRAQSHVKQVIASDGHDGYGLSRYPGDSYYATSIYSPAGNETGSDSPDWPQMSMYLAINAAYQGNSALALNYLTWMTSRSFVGYVAQGEAISRTLGTPVVSTASEPVTGAWFVMAALVATTRPTYEWSLPIPTPER